MTAEDPIYKEVKSNNLTNIESHCTTERSNEEGRKEKSHSKFLEDNKMAGESLYISDKILVIRLNPPNKAVIR